MLAKKKIRKKSFSVKSLEWDFDLDIKYVISRISSTTNKEFYIFILN